ncbi:hypothetical protein HK102_005767 [Quaeritorhiza haematococci]|nr:hypothetical protein HK102_005767 [Quaeritorhiza haematococci]
MEIDTLTADNAHLGERVQLLCQQEEIYRGVVAEAKELTAQSETRIRLLEASMAMKDAIAEQRRREIAVLTSENARLTEEVQSLRGQDASHQTGETKAVAQATGDRQALEIVALSSVNTVLKEHIWNLRRQTESCERDAVEAKAAQISLETEIKSLSASLAAAEAATEATRREITILTASNTTLTKRLHTLRTQQQQTHYHLPIPPKPGHENKVQIRRIASLKKSLRDARRRNVTKSLLRKIAR